MERVILMINSLNSTFYTSMSNVLTQWSDFKVSKNLYKAYFDMQKSQKTSGTDETAKKQNTKTKNTVEDKLGTLSDSVTKAFGNLESTFSVDSKTGEMDYDKAYSAAESFVKSYNDLVSSIRTSGDKSVSNKHEFITNMTNAQTKKLNNAGISINSDGTLTLDKESFMTADTAQLEAIFGKKDSFANFVSRQAAQLKAYSQIEHTVQATNTYTQTGNVTNLSNISGSFFNMLG